MTDNEFVRLLEASSGHTAVVPAFSLSPDELREHLQTHLLAPTNSFATKVICPCGGGHVADVIRRETPNGLCYFAACDAYIRMENYPVEKELLRLYKINPRMVKRDGGKSHTRECSSQLRFDEDGRVLVSVDGVTNVGARALCKSMKNESPDSPVKIGEACPFVTYCSPKDEIVRMRVSVASGTSDVSFKIIGDDKIWRVVKQLVCANSYPIVLKNPWRPSKLNLTARFRESKNRDDTREKFYRYVYCVRKGSCAKYELRAIPRPLKGGRKKGV